MERISRSMAAVAASVAAASLLAGCGGSDLDEECAAAFERAALTVDRVDSAEYECGGSFGNPSQDGKIVLGVDTQEEATPVIEEIYKAFATNDGLDGAWSPGTEFVARGGGASFDDLGLEFNGSPSVGDMRDRYDVHPPSTD
ncbi:hypothetical protein [Promicromonospora sp. NPDC057488]|uniref:hypothetical protein n=1 Tax=Promicromonospora sp. NPDC057488 TaxID=3346147 RepID=UPI00366F488D